MDLTGAFEERFAEKPQVLARAPGRVNLLGEHVDYNDGLVLPAAIDREVRVAASPQPGEMVTLLALDLGEEVSFDLQHIEQKLDLSGKRLPTWALYPAGVAWALRGAGYPVAGLRAVFSSDVPIGAGLSSSAAVEVAFGVLWRASGGAPQGSMELAQLCQRAENGYVGVNCGLMDQFASACGVGDHALFLDVRSLEWRPYPLPPDTAIVIADSGVRRSLASSAYNERRAACEQAVAGLRQYMPGISSLRDVSAPEFAAYGYYLPQPVQKRAEHVVKEIARVESAVHALERGDAQVFGALMYAGHASLRDLYEVSVPELDALVRIARGLDGCYGARLTGAGFGGCTVNLVSEPQAEAFIQNLSSAYQEESGRQANIYLCKASAGAGLIDLP